MTLLREISGMGTRPYPLDRERRKRVMVALAERDMTCRELARALNLPQSLISMIINGRRISPKTEERIAEYLHRDANDLFPERTADDIARMRQAEAAEKGLAA